jgi:DNA-binding transcriptional MerR regulator
MLVRHDGTVTALDIVTDAGISYRQLDFWTRQGYLRPVTAVNPGTGRSRGYPESEVLVAIRMAALMAAGLQLRVAHDIARGDTARIRQIRRALTEASQ